MKILVLILTLSFATSAWAVGRPEPPRREAPRRTGEFSKMLRENVETFNRTARDVLGNNLETGYKLELSKSMTPREMDTMAQRVKALNDALNARKNELIETNKASEVAALLVTANKVFKGRGDVVNFLEREDTPEAKDLLKLMDNLIKIVEVKIMDTAQSPVSYGQILRMMNIINGKIEVGGMTARSFREIEAEITGLLPKNYTMAKAARCR